VFDVVLQECINILENLQVKSNQQSNKNYFINYNYTHL